jgi:hypothetical protein
MGGEGERSGGRGQVLQGRYSKMRDGRFSGNRWEVLENEDEEVVEKRGERREGGEMSDENGDRSSNMETEGTGNGRNEGSDGARGREGAGSVDGSRKRNLEERSPGAHDSTRVNRRKVNEFEMGQMFDEIMKKMGKDTDRLIDKAPDVFKRELREGLEIMVDGMKGIMNGVSDGIASERLAREAEEIRTEDKMEMLMEEVKEIKNVNRGMVNDRMEQRVRASEKEMEEKIRVASCSLKLLDFDFGEVSEDRARMVKTEIGKLREDIFPEEKQGYDRIMRRTRIVILGRKTTAVNNRGRTRHTVPILLECQNKSDAGELETTLRKAGYFSAFHWPQEMVQFVEGVREEVRKMGYRENTHYIRVRPEERGGEIQIRADVKEKMGGDFKRRQCGSARR